MGWLSGHMSGLTGSTHFLVGGPAAFLAAAFLAGAFLAGAFLAARTGPGPSMGGRTVSCAARRPCMVLYSANPMPNRSPTHSPSRKERRTMAANLLRGLREIVRQPVLGLPS